MLEKREAFTSAMNNSVSPSKVFMRRAIALSREAAEAGGGPFGAVVVMGDRIIGEGSNRVVASHDPTAHAEIIAIRAACNALQSHILQNAVIYASSEPCPMCLGAIWWARIQQVFFGNTREDAASIGFDDAEIYKHFEKNSEAGKLSLTRFLPDEAILTFRRWSLKEDRVPY